MPSFRLTGPARNVSARIIADERFKPGVLPEMLSQMEAAPPPGIVQPEYYQAQALMGLSTGEMAAQSNSWEFDREISRAESRLRAALSVTPSDAFLWLMLYSVELARNGFDPAYVSLIEKSYFAGPHEGWIALRRNRLALAVFALLSDVTQKAVVSEFSEMVDSDFIDAAAIILTTIGWEHRLSLLAGLEQADISSRESLARRLSRDGFKVTIPGVDRDDRLWRR
ncbi:hypothetical protein EAS62_03545 [Bradyrhizobium zhanjiangense]|uniref:DNA alkylation repair protein n=2 Tax=Bradyrhizobium zhanjiangense TaxID=1325107 RepID=A0ABY0DU66_9BRAD|nr:hypothetical protein EAS62_03545 [Bradyrhizobium zhanjiangense]